MNLSRFFKARVFYITALITILCFGLFSRLETSPEGRPGSQYENQEQEADQSVGITLAEDITSDTSFEQLYAGFASSGYLLIMVGVFAVVYIEEERKSGFLKNLLTTRRGKKNIFAAKIPIVFLYTLIMFLGSLIAIRIGSLGRGEGMYSLVDAGALVRFVFFEVILHTIFGIAMMAIYEITRNTIIPIMITIFGSANLHGMLFDTIESKLVSMYPSLGKIMDTYALSKNFIVTKTTVLGSLEGSFPYMNIIVIAVIGFTVYSVMGMAIFTKRDTI